jgi:hypothetical protein
MPNLMQIFAKLRCGLVIRFGDELAKLLTDTPAKHEKHLKTGVGNELH